MESDGYNYKEQLDDDQLASIRKTKDYSLYKEHDEGYKQTDDEDPYDVTLHQQPSTTIDNNNNNNQPRKISSALKSQAASKQNQNNLINTNLYSSQKVIVESQRIFLPKELTIQLENLKWNTAFQEAWKMVLRDTLDISTTETGYAKISFLYTEFLRTAILYTKIIVNERFLPVELKTIKPVNLGGVAGGTKYVREGILFKFALDTHNLYKGSSNAAKSAAHELKSLNALFNLNIPQLSLPLFVVLDYRGFRVSAMSLLPIDRSTIYYGSDDGGFNVHCSEDEVGALNELAAKRLNLKTHIAGLTVKSSISMPADIESHKGKDGNIYTIDCARLFPPEPPTTPGSYLWRLLRPEFVQNYPKPLCSDAFTKFIANDPEKEYHNEDLREAFKHLVTNVVVEFGKWLETNFPMNGRIGNIQTLKQAAELNLAKEMHHRGINMRFLGVLYMCLTQGFWKKRVLNEMVYRVSKETLRVLMRNSMQRIGLATEEPYVRVVVDYLNLLFGGNKESDQYWRDELAQSVIATFFYWDHEDESMDPTNNTLRNSISMMVYNTADKKDKNEQVAIQEIPSTQSEEIQVNQNQNHKEQYDSDNNNNNSEGAHSNSAQLSNNRSKSAEQFFDLFNTKYKFLVTLKRDVDKRRLLQQLVEKTGVVLSNPDLYTEAFLNQEQPFDTHSIQEIAPTVKVLELLSIAQSIRALQASSASRFNTTSEQQIAIHTLQNYYLRNKSASYLVPFSCFKVAQRLILSYLTERDLMSLISSDVAEVAKVPVDCMNCILNDEEKFKNILIAKPDFYVVSEHLLTNILTATTWERNIQEVNWVLEIAYGMCAELFQQLAEIFKRLNNDAKMKELDERLANFKMKIKPQFHGLFTPVLPLDPSLIKQSSRRNSISGSPLTFRKRLQTLTKRNVK